MLVEVEKLKWMQPLAAILASVTLKLHEELVDEVGHIGHQGEWRLPCPHRRPKGDIRLQTEKNIIIKNIYK